MKKSVHAKILLMFIALVIGGSLTVGSVQADSAAEADAKVDKALERFKDKVDGAAEFLDSAKGYLVMPNMTKGAFIVGGQYGTGALRVDGKTVDFYNSASGSLGLSIGGERYDFIICFMTDESLEKFRNKSGWEIGLDANVALFVVGAGGKLDTTVTKDPIVAFVYDAKGLIGDISLKGAKFSKIKRD